MAKKRITISLDPMVYERIKSSADDLGLSVHAWCLYTLGTAVQSQVAMREKMTDQMVALMAEAIGEAQEAGTLQADLLGGVDAPKK